MGEPLESNLGNLEGLMKRCSGRAKDAKSAKKVQKAFSRSRGYAFMALHLNYRQITVLKRNELQRDAACKKL